MKKKIEIQDFIVLEITLHEQPLIKGGNGSTTTEDNYPDIPDGNSASWSNIIAAKSKTKVD